MATKSSLIVLLLVDSIVLDLCFYIGSFYFCSCILSYVIFYAFNIISQHFNYHFVSRILNFLHIFVKHVMCQIYYDDGFMVETKGGTESFYE